MSLRFYKITEGSPIDPIRLPSFTTHPVDGFLDRPLTPRCRIKDICICSFSNLQHKAIILRDPFPLQAAWPSAS